MTAPARLTAKLPISPHANLTATARAGTRNRAADWQVACTCGATFIASAYAFRIGETKCQRCQPSLGDAQAIEILMFLPATQDVLAKRIGVSLPTVKSRIRAMKKKGFCHTGKWRRSKGPGDFRPLIVPGPGEDALCTLQALTGAEYSRRFRGRAKAAIEAAEAGDKVDGRYLRRVSLHIAAKTARKTRTEPQGWAAALFVGVRVEPEASSNA